MSTGYPQSQPRTTPPARSRRADVSDSGVWARYANMVLGAWLFLSAFLWSHSAFVRTNTWIVGLLIVAFAGWALVAPKVRWANTVIGAWFFFSTLFAFHLYAGTMWHNLIAAIIVFGLSLVPSARINAGVRTGRQMPV
jgi:hypothetical protein